LVLWRRARYVEHLSLLALSLSFVALVGCAPREDNEVGQGVESETAQASDTVRTTSPGRSERASEPGPDVAEVIASEIAKDSIRDHLASLTGAAPARLPDGTITVTERGSVEGRRATVEYLQTSFEEAGIPARILEFDSTSGPGFNVEATLRGKKGKKERKHLWVTAHLDSVYNAGANDNASGVVMLLLAAKALERLDLDHTVHFVAYDLEEVGQLGSSAYVDSVVSSIRAREGDQAIIGNLNADMIAYEGDQFNAVVGTCDKAGPLKDSIVRASEKLDSDIILGDYCLGRSDHVRFWEAGLPAALLTDGTKFDAYPWYHTPDDKMDKLNIVYLRSMILLAATTSALLAAPENAT
jgi:aminopeptidase-like protein